MLDSESLDRAFSALADPTRRAILERLANGPASVGDLAAPFEISLPAISKHLTVLERARLIRREPEAQWRLCRLDPEGLQPAVAWIDRARAFWTESLDALADYLTEQKEEKHHAPTRSSRKSRSGRGKKKGR
jgi:DNA-binding transcriptional ArsR family regulator